MYTVYANNHFNDVNFEQSFLELKLAQDVFNVATKCVDCTKATLINALTGEVLMDFNYISGIKKYC